MILIVIFGLEDREKDHSSGRFYCPNCRAMRPYKRKRITRDFTLYFIPVLQTKEMAQYVECQVCHEKFQVDVLDDAGELPYEEPERIQPQHSRRRKSSGIKNIIRDRIRDELKAGTPIPEAHKTLVDSGWDKREAAGILDNIPGDMIMKCPSCQATYHRSISLCSLCGSRLKQLPR